MRTHRPGKPFLAPAVPAKPRKPFEGGLGHGAGDEVVTCPECQCRVRVTISGDITKHRPGGGNVSLHRGDVECKGTGIHFRHTYGRY